jgi:glycosyltransferase involved in cell wall biosynthesis
MSEKVSVSNISVVIPAYNCADTICDTLNSLLSQTLLPDEIIVVDDCSTEPVSKKIAKNFPAVTVIRHPENKGVQIARNTGYANVKGEYVLFLDADDLLYPEFLEDGKILLENFSDHAAFFASFHTYSEGDANHLISSHERRPPNPKVLYPEEGLPFYSDNTGAFIPSFSLFRKSALDAVTMEGYLFPPEVWGNEDFHLFVRILSRYPVFHEQNPLGIYYLQPTSISRNQIKVWASRIVALDSLISMAGNYAYPEDKISMLKKMRQVSVRLHARLLYENGIQSEAISALWTELKRAPSLKTFLLFFAFSSKYQITKRSLAKQ